MNSFFEFRSMAFAQDGFRPVQVLLRTKISGEWKRAVVSSFRSLFHLRRSTVIFFNIFLPACSDTGVEVSPTCSYAGENLEAICRGRTFHAPCEITF